MNISFILDREEKIDPNEALGDIIISNKQSEIEVKSTYLDSWFDVLIDGYRSLEKQDNIILEIAEEPELITFSSIQNGYKISYSNQLIVFEYIEDFYQSLLNSTENFIKEFEQENIFISHLPLFIKIKDFSTQPIIVNSK